MHEQSLPFLLTPRILRLSESVVGAWTENTAGNLTTAGVDQADGSILTSLAGGKASAAQDPDDAAAVWAAWPLLDARSRQVTGDVAWCTLLEIDFAGAPVVGDNAQYFLGIINESSPVSATVEGILSWVEFTASLTNPRTRNNYLANGASTSAQVGTAGATVAGTLTPAFRCRGASTILFAPTTVGNDAAGDRISGVGTTQANSPTVGTGSWWVVAGAVRTLVGDADTVQHFPRFRYTPPVMMAAL